MSDVNWEERIDGVDRSKIYEKAENEWLESFKSEDTPIERRIKDYEVNGWGILKNNEKEIKINFHFSVVPTNPENTEWRTDGKNTAFLEMSNVDGEYKVDYISDVPKNYDKFLEEFEKWKKDNTNTETIEVQGKNEDFSSNMEIQKISNGIVCTCLVIIAFVLTSAFIKFRKK